MHAGKVSIATLLTLPLVLASAQASLPNAAEPPPLAVTPGDHRALLVALLESLSPEPGYAPCQPGVGCFDFPLWVDEAGDTMTGNLHMDGDLIMDPASAGDGVIDPIQAIQHQIELNAGTRLFVADGAKVELSDGSVVAPGGSRLAHSLTMDADIVFSGANRIQFADAVEATLGTTEDQPLLLQVNGETAFRLVPTVGAPNLVGGDDANAVGEAAVGATIAGGEANSAEGQFSTVLGGAENHAGGDYSVVAGRHADAQHAGALVLADASSPAFSSTADNEFSVRATGGARIVSAIDENGTATALVELPPGSGSWSTMSDAASKDHFEAVDPRAVAATLAGVPISTWNYRTQDASIRHMGPTAQDFWEAYHLGESSARINSVDADGVALAAAQGAFLLTQEQAAAIAALVAENAELRASLDAQAALLADLEARVASIEGDNFDGQTAGNPHHGKT